MADKKKINTVVSNLDDLTKERIRFAYLKGRSETEISKIFGMTPDDVKLALTGLGVPRRLTGIPGSKAQSPAFIAWAQQYSEALTQSQSDAMAGKAAPASSFVTEVGTTFTVDNNKTQGPADKTGKLPTQSDRTVYVQDEADRNTVRNRDTEQPLALAGNELVFKSKLAQGKNDVRIPISFVPSFGMYPVELHAPTGPNVWNRAHVIPHAILKLEQAQAPAAATSPTVAAPSTPAAVPAPTSPAQTAPTTAEVAAPALDGARTSRRGA